MRLSLASLALGLALAVAGCATPQTRIDQNQAAFASYSPDIQAKIKAGLIEIGFTPQQVELARGKPDFKATRATTTGQAEDWIYGDHRARLGLGIGGGEASGNTAVAGGASISGIPLGKPHQLQVTFMNGVVIAFEGPQQTPR